MQVRASLLLLLLLLVQLLHSATAAAAATGATGEDAEALLGFLEGIDKDPTGALSKTWVRSSVDGRGCPLGWRGVECDLRGRVRSLNLAGLALSGRINPATLGRLAALSSLSLGDNLLAGSLPPDLGRLLLLKHLDLSNNNISGRIPESLSGCASLANLSLASNSLTGDIPAAVLLPSLVRLDLSRNALTGAIPASIVDGPVGLTQVDLSRNRLTGGIPDRLDRLERLQQLDLSGNALSGGIDASWLTLQSLQRVDLSGNRLTGELPWLGTLLLPPNIVYVNLSRNHLSGALAPGNAANLFAGKMEVLDASSNRLTGALPSFEFVFSLRVLRLAANRFTGMVPSALLSLGAALLEELDLSQNRLSGELGAMIAAPRLSLLNLSSNHLTGQLPSRLSAVVSLDLSGNRFSGELSPAMASWGNNLESVNVRGNSLTGALPNRTAQLLRLISLDAAANSLAGSIPVAFAAFPRLTSLDLSHNLLSDALPPAFFSAASLASLSLAGNQLTGELTGGSGAATAPLRRLDLSANRFTGAVPAGVIAELPTLEELNLAGNQLSGGVPAELRQLSRLRVLDLSSNDLTGAISALPPSLDRLNLSRNNLSGSIPPALQSRFPPSAFFPGNLQLRGDEAWERAAPASSAAGGNSEAAPRPPRRHRMSAAVRAGLLGGAASAVALTVALALLLARCRNRRRSKPVFRIVERDIMPKAAPPPAAVLPPPAPPVSAEKAAPPPPPTVGSPDKLAGELCLLDESALALTAEELSRAPAEVLGRSSQGTSYKATLDGGHVMTVKWLKEGLARCRKDFSTEAKRFAGIRHVNLLPLRGYYWGPREHEKLLLTDYVAHGSSLADRLSSDRRLPALTWRQRLRVAADVASGLAYLHLEQKMAHGNLKASNVLLEGPELAARLTDYGLYRLMTATGTASQILNAGALGYRAPELSGVKRPKPTAAADVYAYGVMLLELVTGKGAGDIMPGDSGAVDLPEWVRTLVSGDRPVDCVDEALKEGAPPQELQQLLQLALSCISADPGHRPLIKPVADEVAALYASTFPSS